MDGHNQSKPPKIHRKSFQTKDRYNKELEVYVKLQSLQGECIPRAFKGGSEGDLFLEITKFHTKLSEVKLTGIVITRVIDALAQIHANHVLHFDIKPKSSPFLPTLHSLENSKEPPNMPPSINT
eukprot:TRINITY_DN4032_c0_g1_i2.p1 TRINITY_DN4032_c0_g1~~TRINITY_DN4032_c0_g1_i2.p1  ORF type:complete len:124 (+),score=29.72 TRINITY_DN4032_c0_g1_i2:155-526(+)